MMSRTGVTLRRILGDRRLYLLLAVLLFLFWAGQRMGMPAYYRHDVFEGKIARQAVHPNQAARSLGVEGQFETMEQVWEAFVDDPERAEYYYQAALLFPFFPGLLADFLLSFWLIGRSLQRRQASALLLHGAGRGAAFRQLIFPYLGAALLLRWGFFALDFLCLPIHAEHFPPGYLRASVLFWLLATGADATFFAVPTLRPPAHGGPGGGLRSRGGAAAASPAPSEAAASGCPQRRKPLEALGFFGKSAGRRRLHRGGADRLPAGFLAPVPQKGSGLRG